MDLPRSEFETTFTIPTEACIVNVGSGEVALILITAGEEESAILQLLDGAFDDSPPLIAPMRAPAGDTRVFNFQFGSLTFYDGMYGILKGKGAQATIKGFVDEVPL